MGTRRLLNGLRTLNNGIRVVEEFVLAVTVLALAVLLVSNVVARNFFRSIYFAEEVSMLLVIVSTFVGLGYAVRRARHIRMSAIFDIVGDKAKRVMIICTAILSAATMFYLTYYALVYVGRIRDMQQLTPTLSVPYWKFVAIAPVGFFMAGFRYVLVLIRNIVSKEVWVGTDAKSEYE